jgi:hypothetical protein
MIDEIENNQEFKGCEISSNDFDYIFSDPNKSSNQN